MPLNSNPTDLSWFVAGGTQITTEFSRADIAIDLTEVQQKDKAVNGRVHETKDT